MALDCSIIITNFNKDKYIGRCLRSCLNQSLNKDRYEIIVIDDASTDNSRAIIDSFGITSIFLDKNVGVAEASNIGIKKALAPLIIRVDADDYINTNTLLFMTEIMMNNRELGFVYPDHFVVDENENKIKKVKLDTIESIYRHGAGIMFRKINLEAIGLYDTEFKNAEDHDLLMRYFKNFNGYHLPIPLYRYRQVGGSLSKENRDKWESKANVKNRK